MIHPNVRSNDALAEGLRRVVKEVADGRALTASLVGSRTMGIDIPGSDYDFLLVCAHPVEAYLGTPASVPKDAHNTHAHVPDPADPSRITRAGIHIWDVRKATHLICKSNANAAEAFQEACLLPEGEALQEQLREASEAFLNPQAMRWHYQRFIQQYLERPQSPAKRKLHALRCALKFEHYGQVRRLAPNRIVPITCKNDPGIHTEVQSLLEARSQGDQDIPETPQIDRRIQAVGQGNPSQAPARDQSADPEILNEIARQAILGDPGRMRAQEAAAWTPQGTPSERPIERF